MIELETISALASFATLKCLYDAKKYDSAYQVLAEFISYIVYTQNLYSFSAVEMKNKLSETFDFDIPEAVVKTASKSLSYVTRSNGVYCVDRNTLSASSTFQNIQDAAKNANSNIIDALLSYVKGRMPEQGKTIPKESLVKDLIDFLVDNHEHKPGPYYELIGEFILKHETDAEMQRTLRDIREGSILYIGLNHNINEIGSLTKNITLFLGTEVLFSLVGFNGEVHKQLAQDFFAQVRNANTSSQRIFLRFFPEIKREIEDFFASAESIADGKTSMFDTVAMQSIVNGCETGSDVLVKKSDFYYNLQHNYGIIEYKEVDYYDEKYHSYNLESATVTDEQIQDSWRLVSHINVLRKGKIFVAVTDAEFLIVTNTGNTLKVSKEHTDNLKFEQKVEFACEYACSVNRITNILWYKLGGGFGQKGYPHNADVVVKARTILSALVAKNVSDEYNKAKGQYEAGEITMDQLAARIVTLRKKPTLPETLEGDSIEDIMDFSPEYIHRFEEEVISNKAALVEKEREITRIKTERIQMAQSKDQKIAEKDQVIQEQQDENRKLQSKLNEYYEKERLEAKKKERRKNILLFIWSILWKLSIFIGIAVVVAYYCKEKSDSDILTLVITVGDIIALICAAAKVVKTAFTKYFPKELQSD